MKFSKKILAAVLAALMAISMMPFSAITAFAIADQTGNCGANGDNVTYRLQDTNSDGKYDKLTLSGSGAMADYTSTGAPWYRIGDITHSFYINSLTIADGITHIGQFAFTGFIITSINIPTSITSIGKQAFTSCKSIKSITLPDSVTTIGTEAFKYCEKLETFNFPDNVTSLGNGVFLNCTSLKNVKLPNNLTKIPVSTFSWCTSLQSVTIPSGVISIEDYAFQKCTSLQNVTIPSGVTTIGKKAFSDCTALSTATFERPSASQSLAFGADAFTNSPATIAFSGSGADLYDGETLVEENATLSSFNNKTLNWVVSGVASVNGVGYPTLEEAIEAAQDGDTIKILEDLVLDNTIGISDGKKFTIDTNGKTISSAKRVFEIRHGGVTLTGNGTVSTTAVSAIAVYGSTDSTAADYATFTLGEDTTISAPNGYGAMIGANSKAAYGAKLTLNGTIDSQYGVYINGNVQEPADKTNAAQVTINGTVNAGSENAAVYAAGYAKWTVNEDSIISGGSGIYIKSGDLAVNGGTITATGTKTAYAFNPNGANGTGDAIIIDSCGYPGNVPTVTINAGTISSTNGDAVASYTKQDDPLYPDAEFAKVTNVIPGTSTAVFSSDVTELASGDYKTAYDEEKGGYIVEAPVYVNGVGYPTLEEALAAAPSGATVKLNADIDYSTIYTVRNARDNGNEHIIDLKDCTLDLNGHTISTINGTVEFCGNGATIENGTFNLVPKNTDGSYKDGSYALIIDNSGNYGENAKVTVNNVVCNGAVNACCATVELNEVTARTTPTKFYAVWAETNATVIINSGTYTDAQSGGRGVIATGSGNEGGATIEVKGGTFEASNKIVATAENNSILISGGSFSKVVDEKYCADGFVPVTEPDETGKYTVKVDDEKDLMSVTVTENVDINLYLADSSNKIKTVEFTYNSAPDKEDYVETTVTKNATHKDGYVPLKVKLAPAQIKDAITVVAYDANGNEVKEVTTSIADYCNTIINGNFESKLKDLAKATLDYGKAAANYFGYNASAYTDANYLDAPTFNAGDYETPSTSYAISGVSYVAKSEPELRFYIDMSGAFKGFEDECVAMNESITCTNGTARFVKTVDESGNRQIILQVKNINITDFGKEIDVKVGGDSILKYTPILWVIGAKSVGGNLGTLADGIGNYYAKSVAYFKA